MPRFTNVQKAAPVAFAKSWSAEKKKAGSFPRVFAPRRGFVALNRGKNNAINPAWVSVREGKSRGRDEVRLVGRIFLLFGNVASPFSSSRAFFEEKRDRLFGIWTIDVLQKLGRRWIYFNILVFEKYSVVALF